MIVTHNKNRHRSRPFILKRVDGLHYKVKFNESCKYHHGDSDQLDWNKLFGVKQRYFQPRKNSIMGAWRYNPDADLFELATYQHNSKGGIHIHNRRIVRMNEFINFRFYDMHKGWLILPWFGGQKKAPHRMEIEVEFI